MTIPRCDKHRDRETAPVLCPTCARIAVEQDIVTRAVDALIAAGYRLRTDLHDDPRPDEPTTERAAILAEMRETDDEFLGVYRPEDFTPDDRRPYGWIRFVYGNGGYDVISDYTINLEPIIDPIMAYAGTLA
jgi:hypothetical protein